MKPPSSYAPTKKKKKGRGILKEPRISLQVGSGQDANRDNFPLSIPAIMPLQLGLTDHVEPLP